jgi:hypothetical protein
MLNYNSHGFFSLTKLSEILRGKEKDIAPPAECSNYPKFRHVASTHLYPDTYFLAYRGTSMKYEILKRSLLIYYAVT